MDWWTRDADMTWLGSMTTWWILGPLIAVLVLWAVLKLSERTTTRRARRSARA